MESEETPEGDWLGFTSFMENPPSLSSHTEGRVEGDQLFLTTMVGGKTTEKKQPWNTTLKSPAWQDRMLHEQPLKPGEERTLESFEPQFSRPMTVTIKALEPEEITMPGGERRKLNKIAVTQSLDPKLVQYSYLDDDLKTVKTTTMMLGTEMVTWSVSKEEALKELSGEDVDLAIATLIRTGKIERSLETQSVVYRVTLVDDDPAKYLTEGPTQSIRRIDPHTVELTVRSLVPPESAEVDAKPADERYLALQQVSAVRRRTGDEIRRRSGRRGIKTLAGGAVAGTLGSPESEGQELLDADGVGGGSRPHSFGRLHRTCVPAGGDVPGEEDTGSNRRRSVVRPARLGVRRPHVDRSLHQRRVGSAGRHVGTRPGGG